MMLSTTDRDEAYKRKYQKIKKIGEGTYAVVYLAKQVDTGRIVAIKKIKIIAGSSGLDFSALREIKYLQEFKHENIVDVRKGPGRLCAS
jgi:cyclin-dependent kinase 7